MADIPALDELDDGIRGLSLDAMGAEIELLDPLILHINHGISPLTGQKHDRGLNFLICTLMGRAFNSLWRGREDAVCGYPAESLTLCRSVIEHWCAARWVELHPNALDRWLWDIFEEIERPAEFIPKVTQMLKDLGEVGEPVLEVYDVLSKFVHPRSTGLRWLIHFDSETTFFHVGGEFDKESLKICLYFLIASAQACLEPVARLQNRTFGVVNPEWLEEGKSLSENGRGIHG